MPTDEQRKQFEAHYVRLYPGAHMGRNAEGDYTNGLVLLQWDMWKAACSSRDAEVQALREALEQIRDAPWPRSDHAEFSESLQEIARAALAGEEATDG